MKCDLCKYDNSKVSPAMQRRYARIQARDYEKNESTYKLVCHVCIQTILMHANNLVMLNLEEDVDNK